MIAALRLLPFIFLRSGELRAAEWSEIDLETAEWRIPPERMKMKKPHLVPLSIQAVGILEQVHPITGHGRLVFTSLRTTYRCLSKNTLSAALRRLGYSKD